MNRHAGPPEPAGRSPEDPEPPARSSRRSYLLVAAAVVALVLLVLGVRALVRDAPPAAGTAMGAPAPTGAPVAGGGATGGTVAYRLQGRGRAPVTVRLEVASTPASRERGLMARASLPAGHGMVFLFPRDDLAAFWMKNTLVPLSIAYVAADGRVVSVDEMTPCRADPCPSYAPAGPYRYAVELPAGSFPAAGVGAGDRVVPLDPSALPVAT